MDDLSLEFEGLRAIYMEDFEEIEKDEEDKKSLTQCKVHLVPNPGQELGNFVGLELWLTFPTSYPNEAPIIELRECEGIDKAGKQDIMTILNKTVQDSLSMPMVFNLASAVKEWLDEHNVDPAILENLKRLKEVEEKEKKRSQGTPVNADTFKEWQKKFLDKRRQESKKEQTPINVDKRPSGRQLFERNADLVQSDTNFKDEGDAVEVDWNLFKPEDLEDEIVEHTRNYEVDDEDS